MQPRYFVHIASVTSLHIEAVGPEFDQAGTNLMSDSLASSGLPTRPDTLFGASFLAISADHPLAKDAAAKNPAIEAFCDEVRRAGTSLAALETAEKKGIDTGGFLDQRGRFPLR